MTSGPAAPNQFVVRVKSWIIHTGSLVLVVAACVLAALPVASAQPAAPSAQPAAVQEAAAASPATGSRGLLSRHWFKGLLCASFLLICALAGRNDRLKGDQPAPNQPPPTS